MKRQSAFTLLSLYIGLLGAPQRLAAASPQNSSNENPLLIYVKVQNEFLQSDSSGKSLNHQQHISYIGTSLKPVSFGDFHIGLKSKMTKAENMGDFYIEPASFIFASTLQVIKRYMSVAAGLKLPLSSKAFANGDSTALSTLANQNTFLSEPYILPSGSFFLGAYLHLNWKSLNFNLGQTYLRSNKFFLFDTVGYISPQVFNSHLEVIIPRKKLIHKINLKLSTYSAEKDQLLEESPAHTEGALIQSRYMLRIQLENSGLEMGLGSALKAIGENRDLYQKDRPLSEEQVNTDWQKVYFNTQWYKINNSKYVVDLGFSPQYLFRESGEAGVQAESELGFKFPVGQGKYCRLSFWGMFGSLEEKQLWGGGTKVSFWFHRLNTSTPELYPSQISSP